MTLKKEVYEKIRYRIITNDLGPGDQLFEKELMHEYQIGRTPLREILMELQQNGLIEILPKLGTRVVSLDLRTLREIVQLRRELEGLAAELAVTQIKGTDTERLKSLLKEASEIPDDSPSSLKHLSEIDIEFHKIIYNASGNRQLTLIIESLLYKMSMYWFQVGFSAADFREQFEELENLVKAIEKKEDKDARQIMKRHIDHFTTLVKENFFS
jgi:GntR family transcriptional regulator, rspAB operon transcriptional repressor